LQKTFHYDSPYWTDKNTYGLKSPEGETGLDHEETKLPTYWNTPFTKICLGMTIPGEDTRFLALNMKASSLDALIVDGKCRPTTVGRHQWKTLIGYHASLQPNCNREGFNVMSDNPPFSKARIGDVCNQENDCVTGDSRIGFGTGGHQRDFDS